MFNGSGKSGRKMRVLQNKNKLGCGTFDTPTIIV